MYPTLSRTTSQTTPSALAGPPSHTFALLNSRLKGLLGPALRVTETKKRVAGYKIVRGLKFPEIPLPRP